MKHNFPILQKNNLVLLADFGVGSNDAYEAVFGLGFRLLNLKALSIRSSALLGIVGYTYEETEHGSWNYESYGWSEETYDEIGGGFFGGLDISASYKFTKNVGADFDFIFGTADGSPVVLPKISVSAIF